MRRDVTLVAIVAEAFGGYGGIAQSTQDTLVAAASKPRIASISIFPRLTRNTPVIGSNKIRQFRPIYSRILFLLNTLMLTATKRPGIIYCGHIFMAPLALLLAKLSGAKFIVHVHGLEVWTSLTRLQSKALIASDLILTVSNDTSRRLIAIGAPERRIHLVFNTVGEEFTAGDRNSARTLFGLSNQIALLTVSRLDAPNHKGHEAVIALLPELRRAGRDVVYLIAGTGSDHNRLCALAHAQGVGDYVRFLGKVPAEDLPDLYRAADLYVMPSKKEGFGIAFVEAMCCGTPAIGLSVGGAPDALCDGELGIAASQEGFRDAVFRAVDALPNDRAALASATRARFGRPVFERRVHSALETILD